MVKKKDVRKVGKDREDGREDGEKKEGWKQGKAEKNKKCNSLAMASSYTSTVFSCRTQDRREMWPCLVGPTCHMRTFSNR
jgi:hypothetical protein